MITKLTKKQEQQLKVYRDKWIENGISTKQITHDVAIPLVQRLYHELLDVKYNVPVVIMDNPYETWLAVLYCQHIENYILKYNQVGNQVRIQVDSQVRNQARNQVENQVWNQVEIQVWNQVENQVYNQVRNQVENQVWNQVRNQVENFVYPYLDGNFNSSYCSFYDFCKEVLSIKNFPKSWELYKKISQELSFVYPLKYTCILCQKPTQIRFNKDRQLHGGLDPAIEYKRWNLYAINGVKVPKYLAVTPESELKLEWFHEQKNADIRAEFIKKFGVDRMLSLGKKVDSYEQYNNEWWTKSEYEIYDMAPIFSSIKYAPHLKMKNQTTGIIHVEALHPSVKNLTQAFETTRWNGRKISNYKTEDIK